MLALYFVGLSATLKTNAPLYGITASETRGSICVKIFDSSKSIDLLEFSHKRFFGILFARVVVLHYKMAETMVYSGTGFLTEINIYVSP